MNRIGKIMTGFALAAGVFGSSAAMAMEDGAMEDGYVTDDSTTTYYHQSPGTTYQYSPPATTYYYSPGTTYSENYTYAPQGAYGYYDNPYNPYWSYRGPLGQGSGHDMRIGR